MRSALVRLMILMLVSLAVIGSSCSSAPEVPERKKVAAVRVPDPVPAPNLIPVEKATESVRREVDAARNEIQRAADKVGEGVKEATVLKELADRAFREADERNKEVVSQLKEAAEATSQKLDETSDLLVEAKDALTRARQESESLTGEVAGLKADLAVQSKQVGEMRNALKLANMRVQEAEEQSDKFNNSLTEMSVAREVEEKEKLRYRARARRWMWATLVLGVLLAAALYLIFKV